MTQSFEQLHDTQSKLIYSMIVAGKSADFADKATRAFLEQAAAFLDKPMLKTLPFEIIRSLTEPALRLSLHISKTGNYAKLQKGFKEIVHANLDLFTCQPEDLEKIHGIGPKTSRFFIMWIRPEEEYAALDVHVLRWLRGQGYHVPASTPGNRAQYAIIEEQFLYEAKKRKLTPRELDKQIWTAGAGRTQETPLP